MSEFDESATWKTAGVVDSLDVEGGTLTLWVRGFDDLQTVPILDVMPAWLLAPEAAFCTSIPRRCVQERSLENNTSWGFFEVQPYSDLSEDELWNELAQVLASMAKFAIDNEEIA